MAGCAVFFSLNVLGNYYFNFRVAGEPGRLVPELDLVLIILAATVLRWMWDRPGMALRGVAVAIVAGGLLDHQGLHPARLAHVPLWPNYQDRIEYKISEWFWKNMPDARTLPSGSVRFWYDAWHDLPQLGGGSEQGLLNGEAEQAQWEINLGPNPEPAILWMQSMGVDAVYVSDKQSQEMFKDFEFPQKFDGVLPVIFDDQQGNKIYRVPRRYPARVRVVETARLNAAQPPAIQRRRGVPAGLCRRHRKGPRFARHIDLATAPMPCACRPSWMRANRWWCRRATIPRGTPGWRKLGKAAGSLCRCARMPWASWRSMRRRATRRSRWSS